MQIIFTWQKFILLKEDLTKDEEAIKEAADENIKKIFQMKLILL